MNFHFNPNWPAIPKFDGIGPPGGGLWIFRWDEGMCWISAVDNYKCGEDGTVRITVGLIPPGHGIFYSYSACVAHGDVTITSIEPHKGLSATINIKIDDDYDGTAVICGKVGIGGQVLQEVVVESPFSGGKLAWEKALALPPQFQVSTIYRGGYQLDCGCQEITVTCTKCDDSEMTWNTTASAETVAANSSCSVAVEDPYGTSGPFNWEVTGSGFWLDSGYSTKILTNAGSSILVYTEPEACGSATVVCTGCGGNSTSGVIRCTVGTWDLIESCTGTCSGSGSTCRNIIDQYKHENQYYQFGCSVTCASVTCNGSEGECNDGGFCRDYSIAKNCGQYHKYEWICE